MRAQSRRLVTGLTTVKLSWVFVASAGALGAGCTYELDDWGKGPRPSLPDEVDGETTAPVTVVAPSVTSPSGQPTPVGGASCENGRLDGTETHLDCGGECAPCADGARCAVAGDCESRVCVALTCQPASCDDGVANGDESDVDCGSDACEPCANGRSCKIDDDCEGDVCLDAVCTSAQCTDGRLNGDETDVDCGGSCTACGADDICRVADDCQSGVCVRTSTTTSRCSAATCNDGERNAYETDVDCGGSNCAACDDGASCRVADDCESRICDEQSAVCNPATCSDGVQNGSEFEVDCGGGCDLGCAEGARCAEPEDCASGRCDDGVCQDATCTDAIRNQGESDVDCGGPCVSCGAGFGCGSDADCMSADCDGLCLAGAAGAACLVEADCRSGWCVDEACQPGYVGAACETGTDCHSGYCNPDGSCGLGSLGRACLTPEDCASERCADTCQTSRFSIQHTGGSDPKLVSADLIVQSNASDPARTWAELAIVYFFTVGSGESHTNYLGRYVEGPDRESRDGRFLALNASGADWMMVWRSLATNTAPVPGTATTIRLQLRDDGWPAFNLSNDHSYRAGAYSENPNIVVCQRADARWVHTQGTPPSTIPDPCSLIVDDCGDAAVPCDTLERDD